jgi:hypothetical protein
MRTLVKRSSKWMPAVVLALVAGVGAAWTVGLVPATLHADAPDKEDGVDGFRLDVFVVAGGHLENPIGFCTVEPCGAGETVPSAPLFNLTGSSLDVTWGDFQTASARSRASCKDGTTTVRVRLSNLRPNAVYSLFYRTFGPDSINPFCSNEERSIVVPEKCNGSGCVPIADSRIETNDDGEASYVGEVEGCLLDATTLLFDVIYHLNGQTYGPLPNRLEFETQHPEGCTDCPPCHSSFGNDAMRQAVIIQKAP